MQMILKIILITVSLLALAFAGIGIKLLLKKNGTFAGTCASQNPLLQKEGARCGLCGAEAGETCQKEEKN